MTKKHFELIAAVVRSLIGSEPRETRTAVAKAFCTALASQNPKFKPSTFLRACGVDEA